MKRSVVLATLTLILTGLLLLGLANVATSVGDTIVFDNAATSAVY